MRIKIFLHKLKGYRWALRSILYSIYFNFHYLPFKQAIYLPILLYKPKLLKCKGCVRICKDVKVRFGMIQLGKYNVSLYPDTGFVYENHGGEIEFKGNVIIGNASALSIGKTGNVIFGDNFCASCALKLTSYHQIIFERNVRCGWECLFIDTDFHRLTSLNNDSLPKPYGKIHIGHDSWFAYQCSIMKNTELPEYTTVAGRSLINKKIEISPYSLLAGSPAKVIKTGIYRNINDDIINYE